MSETKPNTNFYIEDVVLLVGDDGTGKTYFALKHPDKQKGIYIDFENRYKALGNIIPIPDFYVARLEKQGKDDNLVFYKDGVKTDLAIPCIVHPIAYNEVFEVDIINSVNILEKLKIKILQLKPGLIVIDGLETLRELYIANWEKVNEKTAYGVRAYADINEDIRRFLFPLLNYCRHTNSKMIMTTHLKTLYTEQGEPTNKKEINAKQYIKNLCDGIYMFKLEDVKYYMRRLKSRLGANEWQDITNQL